MHSRFDLSRGRVPVIGASRAGVGAAMARAFQHAGATVAITGAEPEPAPEDRDRFVCARLDVTEAAAVRALAEAFHGRLKAGKGTLINIASMYAMFGSPRNPAYGASKAAVVQLTKSFAIVWAGDGIRVKAFAHGFIGTEQSARRRTDPAHVAPVNLRSPFDRRGQPEDVAGPVLFRASAAAGFMTGTCLAIDGGYSVA